MAEHVKVELSVNGEFHVHHHFHSASQPGAAEILNSVRDAKETIVTQLSEALATLAADDQQLGGEVDALVQKLGQMPAEIQSAVQAAMDQAGVDTATAVAAATAIDQQVRLSIASAVAALTPTPADPGAAPAGSATANANAGGGDQPATTAPNVQDSNTTSVDVGDSLVTDAGASATVSGGGAAEDVGALAPDPDPSGTGPGQPNITGTDTVSDPVAPGEPIEQV